MALGDLYGHLPQGVVVEPKLLKVHHVANPWAQFHDIIETQVQTRQIHEGEDFRQHCVQVQLVKVQTISFLRQSQTSLDFVVLGVTLVCCQQFVRFKVTPNLHI